MYGGDLSGMFLMFGLMCAAIGAAIFGILFWLVPLLWEWIKPWLHAITS